MWCDLTSIILSKRSQKPCTLWIYVRQTLLSFPIGTLLCLGHYHSSTIKAYEYLKGRNLKQENVSVRLEHRVFS